MMPESIRADSQVEIHDSCNQCCCFGWKRRDKKTEETRKKVERQKAVIDLPQQNPRRKRPQHKVTQIHLDATMSDDVEFVMDYKVSPGKESPHKH